MALFSVPGIKLSGICAAVPQDQSSNEELTLLSKAQRAQFIKSVGIKTRRIAAETVCASDLCITAAQHLLGCSTWTADELGALVFVTQTPDYPLPGNSMLAQHRLGLSTSTYLVDLNQGCAGYVYGLASLACLMHSTDIEKGLLLAGDTITRLLSPTDTSTVPIFSDAGSATLLTQAAGEIMHFNLGSDGGGAEIIQVEGGGARQPFNEHGPASVCAQLSMRGVDVLQYSLKHVAPNVRELLGAAGADIDAPDYYVLHQANKLLNQTLLRMLGVADRKAPETLYDYGNTSIASIPVTICHRLGEALRRGSNSLLLSGFGAGFSWGSALLRTDSILCPDLLELVEPHGS